MRWLRWLARGVGSLVAGSWLLIGIIQAIAEHLPRALESYIMAGLIIDSVIGVVVAWWSERIGGTLLIAVGLTHVVFALSQATRNRGLAVDISGVPFLLIGALFLASWWTARHDRATGDLLGSFRDV